ncbi:MAG: carbohydrate ABC transporter permease [Betaproteobacteria bacterium]|nr:carbohydrate ABC transporter permease [Betaproteobacteria bacterium]
MPTLAAYSMHRLAGPPWVAGHPAVWSVVFHMVPPITMVRTVVRDVPHLGLGQRLPCLILANVALNLPMGICLMSLFVRDVPIEIEEAARIDGGTAPQMLRRIMFHWCCWVSRRCRSSRSCSAERIRRGPEPDRERAATVPVAIAKFAQVPRSSMG